MKKYKTKQRECIYNYLKDNSNNYLSVEEIKKGIEKQGVQVGSTTVYRNLNELVDSEEVLKIMKDDKVYMYKFKPDKNRDYTNFKCNVCDKIYDFTCNELIKFNKHMKKHHMFEINFKNTIISGVCKECGDNNV